MSRNAAAASADPPPSPAPDGSRLVSAKRPSARPSIRPASSRTARNTRFSVSGPATAAIGPATLSSSGAPGQKVRRSPNDANATRLSSSWKPSARRPRIRRVRLIFAGAIAASDSIKSEAATASSAVADTLLLLVGVGRVRLLLLEADLELLFDFRQLIVLGLEVSRMGPLELCFQHAIDFPVYVTQVVVDGRVDRLEFDRALQVLHRLFVIAKPVVGPAQRVDDVAVIGPLLDRSLDHAHALVEMDALVDPRITKIVEHVRLVGKQLQRPLEIGFRLRPLLAALETDAAEVVNRPVCFCGLRDQADCLAIAIGATVILFALALDVGERNDCVQVVRLVGNQLFEMLLGVLGALHGVEIDGELDFSVALEGRGCRHALIGLNRKLGLLQRLVEIGERNLRKCVVGLKIERKL